YSQGYNPHWEMYLSPALSLGVESLCEYVAVKGKREPAALVRLNAVANLGLEFLTEHEVLSVNLSAVITKAKYVISARGIGKYAMLLNGESVTLEYIDKGKQIYKECRHLIYDAYQLNEDNLIVVVACGNTNLRADRVAKYICAKSGIDYNTVSIVKSEMYVSDLTVEEYIEQLEKIV
ncbi:MAG: DUF2344 domain-containing protein, partial [Clostridia bacterium]